MCTSFSGIFCIYEVELTCNISIIVCAVYYIYNTRLLSEIYYNRGQCSVQKGHAIAQAVSRWLPTAAVRGSNPSLVMWDFVVDKVALGQVFSEYFGFPCQISFHQLLQKSSSSIMWGLYNRPEVAAVPRDLVPPHQ
jgi:hypothetical protein